MRVILLMMVFLLSLQTTGQESISSLSVPTPAEYLHQLDKIDFNTISLDLKQTIVLEVNWRYVQSGNLTFEQLYEFYTRLLNPQDIYAPYVEFLSTWMRQLVALWAEQAHVEDRTVHYRDLTIEMIPMDFRDGLTTITLYRVDIMIASRYHETYFLREFADQFEILPLSLNQFRVDQEIFFFEHNRTGLSLFGSVRHDSDNTGSRGQFSVLTWRNHQLETILNIRYFEAPNHQYPLQNRFSYSDDPIFHHQDMVDSWGCHFTRITTYDYIDEVQHFQQSAAIDQFSDEFECFVRQAEDALWQHDYSTAIQFYERSLDLDETIEPALKIFSQVRLGVAYILNEQADVAQTLVATIPQGEDSFADDFLAAYQHSPDPLSFCQTFYDAVANRDYELSFWGSVEIFDGHHEFGYIGTGFFIENVACDFSSMLKNQFMDTTLPAEQSPLELFSDLGVAIENFIQADFDQNGQDEWIIWTSWGIDPVFFYAGNGTYQLSFLPGYLGDSMFQRTADLRFPSDSNHYAVISLPDSSGTILANLDQEQDSFMDSRCGGCGGGGFIPVCSSDHYPPAQRVPGDLTLWRMKDGLLETIYFENYCGSSEIPTLFRNQGRELHAAFTIYQPHSETATIIPAVYQLDQSTGHYELSMEPTPFPTPTSAPLSELRVSGSFIDAFRTGDFGGVIVLTDALTSQDPNFIQAQYFRALAYEALQQPIDAATPYLAIYHADPESLWGILAAMHLNLTSP